MAQRNHYLTLDGLRGVAALAVVLLHAGSQIHAELAPAGYLAVDLFFVLSGFVIANAYEGRLATGLSFREFSWIRIQRLYPLYLAGLVLGLGYSLMAVRGGWGGAMSLPQTAGAFVIGLFMLPTPQAISGVSLLFPLNLPAWSLLFELIANAVYALGAHRLGNRAMIALVAVSAVGVAATAAVVKQVAGGAYWHDILIGYPRVFFAFFGGVVLFRLLRDQPVRTSNPAVLGALAGLAALLLLGRPGPWHDALLVIVVFPLLVALCTRIQPSGRLGAVCTWLGAISYAIYVIHSPLLLWIDLCVDHFELDRFGPAVSIVLRIVPAVVAAVVADRFWDIPVRQWLRRRPRLSAA